MAERPEDSLTGSELLALRSRFGNPLTQSSLAALLGETTNSTARHERDEMAISRSLGRLVIFSLAEHNRTSPKRVRVWLLDRRARYARFATKRGKKK
jgi:hypothetical protein